MPTPVQLDFSKAQPISQGGGGVTLDFSKAQPIAQSSPAPSMTANPRGEGTYPMWDTAGKMHQIPFSAVNSYAKQGFKFDTNPIKDPTNKDRNGLDPSQAYQRDLSYATTGPGHEAEYAASDRNAPLPMQAVSGVVKGIGTVGKPAMDVVGRLGGVPQSAIDSSLQAQTPMEMAAKVGTMGAVAAPAAVMAPAATAGGLVGGGIGAGVGHMAANAIGASPENAALMEDAGGIVGGIGGAKLGGPIYDLLPNKARAVNTLNEVSQAAKDVPVQMTATDPAVGGFKQYVATGGRGTPVINKLAKRMAATDEQGPLMFPEARQFYTNVSRSSARPGFLRRAIESPSAPDMRRNLGNVREAMSNDLTDTAGSVGMGDKYTQGMTEYKNAARLNRAAKVGGTIAAEEALRRSGLLGKIASGAANMAGR